MAITKKQFAISIKKSENYDSLSFTEGFEMTIEDAEDNEVFEIKKNEVKELVQKEIDEFLATQEKKFKQQTKQKFKLH